MNITVDEEIRAYLQAAAKREKTTQAQIIRNLIVDRMVRDEWDGHRGTRPQD